MGPRGVWVSSVQQAESPESEPPRCGAEGVCGSNLKSREALDALARKAIQPLAIVGMFGVPPDRPLSGILSGGVCIPSPLMALTISFTAQTPWNV